MRRPRPGCHHAPVPQGHGRFSLRSPGGGQRPAAHRATPVVEPAGRQVSASLRVLGRQREGGASLLGVWRLYPPCTLSRPETHGCRGTGHSRAGEAGLFPSSTELPSGPHQVLGTNSGVSPNSSGCSGVSPNSSGWGLAMPVSSCRIPEIGWLGAPSWLRRALHLVGALLTKSQVSSPA